MKNLKTTIAFSTVAAAALLAACSKSDEITCGAGTELSGDQCVASLVTDNTNEGGAGGGEATGFDDVPAERRDDAQATVDQFEGAIAAAPASDTIALVVWEPVDVFGVEYNIYVSTDADNFSFGTPQETAEPGTNSRLLPGLESGGEYFIVIRPVIEGVELVDDDVVVSVTLGADEDSPSFTGVQSVEAAEGSQLTVSWEAGSDGENGTPPEALQYFIYIGETADDVNFLTAHHVSAPGATSATFRVPQPETEYAVVVRVRDAAGNFDDSEDAELGTSGPDVEAPTFGGCEVAAARNASSLTLTWTPAVDDIATEDEIVYNFYASTEEQGINFSQPSATVVGGSEGILPDLEADETYYVVCRAADPSGNEEDNERIQFATTKDDDVPPVFLGVSNVDVVGSDSVTISWDAATDNQTLTDDITYRVFLSDTEDGHDFETWDENEDIIGATATEITGLTSRTDYYIVVLAFDDADNPSMALPATAVTTKVSLRQDIEIAIFSNKCATSNCHSGETPAANMVLSPGFSFNSIVNVNAVSAPAELRVNPGEPTLSHLYRRINGDTEPGLEAMPPASSLIIISDTEKATIEQWIAEGALNN